MGSCMLAGITKILYFCINGDARNLHSVLCYDVKLLFSKVPEVAECAGQKRMAKFSQLFTVSTLSTFESRLEPVLSQIYMHIHTCIYLYTHAHKREAGLFG